MKFSILIAAIPSRISLLTELLEKLELQRKPDVEILVLMDNRKRSVGQKRTDLLNIANGEYIAFVDDDDTVSPDYIGTIITTLNNNPGVDVMTFTQITSFPDGRKQTCKYSVNFEYKSTDTEWKGIPAHTMVWRKDLVKNISFPHIDCTEDVAWCKLASAQVTTEVSINKVLYFYRFDGSKSMAVPANHKNARPQ